MQQLSKQPAFELGQIVATPGALSALKKAGLWAYPLMIVTLAVFVCYQIYRFALSHSVLMILLTLFNVVVIFLTWLEYGQQRSRRQTESPRTTQS